jgi:putative PIN family toxin of toxin-antitoxin system
MRRVVLDTAVLVAAIRSRLGASNKLLSLIGQSSFDLVLSVPLALEYEDALMREVHHLSYTKGELLEILDFVCGHAITQPIYYLWRPFLQDPSDDHVLEVAIAGQCDTIVTFNVKDFRGVDDFGINVQTPGTFLREITS